MITKEQLTELHAAAEAAHRPGVFWYQQDMLERFTRHFTGAELDATYIAAANPAMVLALMADNEAKAVRIAELEQDLVGAFVRIGELEYEVEAAGEAPPILGAADLAAGNRYWARHGPNMKWALIDVSNVEGIEYGMKNWQFVGPVIPPAV